MVTINSSHLRVIMRSLYKLLGEHADGDDPIGLDVAGVVWPTNTYSAIPRLLSSDDPEWSLWLTHEFNESHSLSFGK